MSLFSPCMMISSSSSSLFTCAGFEVSKLGCCGSGTVEVAELCNVLSTTCRNASEYVFWDSYHPTQRANELLIEMLIQKYANFIKWWHAKTVSCDLRFQTCCDENHWEYSSIFMFLEYWMHLTPPCRRDSLQAISSKSWQLWWEVIDHTEMLNHITISRVSVHPCMHIYVAKDHNEILSQYMYINNRYSIQ